MITKLKLALLVAVLAVFQINLLSGQTLAPPSKIEVHLLVTPGDTTTLFGDSLFSQYTQLKGRMVVVLSQASDILKIHVKLGSSSGATDLFQKNFDFDHSGSLGDGTSYIRKGNIVYLGLGSFTGLNHFFAEVQLEDLSGNLTSAVTYHR